MLAPNKKAYKYLLISQLSFWGLLVLCAALIPRYFTSNDEGGVSNYGVTLETVVPYTLAFLSASWLVMRAARILPVTTPTLKWLRIVLYIFSGLLLLVLVSTFPYKINSTLSQLHASTATVFIGFEAVTAIWLGLFAARDKWNMLLLIAFMVGLGLAIATLNNWLHLLFVSQFVTSVLFGGILLNSTKLLLTIKSK
ncbi:MAG: hypothetical protein ABI220_03900 [Candidatus Saccharimonadales bacterium]